jgi:phosphoribosylanthranilate isomerase
MVWGDGRHALLVDQSGGRGIKPEQWVRPNTSKPVGFAGGLGPNNLDAEMRKMPLRPRSWVDMESGLRNEQDWFDVTKAEACIKIWREC